MATSPEARVRISADDSLLRQSLRELIGHMRTQGSQMGSAFTGALAPLQVLRERFIAISAVLGGGALFAKVIQDTTEFTQTAMALGRALGESATGGSAWVAALEDVGASADELSTASRGLLKNVRDNEDGLKAMGLATRDTAGNLRPMTDLMLDAIGIANEYADGTDRQVAVQQLFGKGVGATSNLLKLNSDAIRENAEFMDRLGLMVGKQGVESHLAYDDAMDKAALTMRGFTNAIGQALLPVLTRLAEWFNTIGPAAVTVTRGAVGGLVSVFWGLKNAVTIAWEVINAMVVTVAEPLRAMSSAIMKVVTGDFAGAAAELKNWPSNIGAAWRGAWAEIVASSEDAQQKIFNLFAKDEAAAAPTGGRRAKVSGGDEPKSTPNPSSYMQYYEALLEEERRAQAILDAGREYSKQQEMAFWRFLLDNATLTAADQLNVRRKLAGAELDLMRDAAKEREKQAEKDAEAAKKAAETAFGLTMESARGAEALALAKLDAERAAAEGALELGQITKAQLADLELQFEDRKFGIQAGALRRRLELLALDPTFNPVEAARLQNELILLEQQYQARRIALVTKSAQQGGTVGGDLVAMFGDSGRYQTMLNGFLQQTLSWRQALGGIFADIGQIFIRRMVVEPAAAYVAGLAKMLLVKMGFLGQEQAADAVASTTKIGLKATETAAVTSANAVQAGTGAAASQAAIPIIGPGLALAAMAAVFAAVSSLGKGSVRSARGGFDIPFGLNPMTQLHEEEMVLPSPLARAVRRMAGEDGEPAKSQAPAPIELRGASAGDFFIANRRELLRVLGQAQRGFAL